MAKFSGVIDVVDIEAGFVQIQGWERPFYIPSEDTELADSQGNNTITTWSTLVKLGTGLSLLGDY